MLLSVDAGRTVLNSAGQNEFSQIQSKIIELYLDVIFPFVGFHGIDVDQELVFESSVELLAIPTVQLDFDLC